MLSNPVGIGLSSLCVSVVGTAKGWFMNAQIIPCSRCLVSDQPQKPLLLLCISESVNHKDQKHVPNNTCVEIC